MNKHTTRAVRATLALALTTLIPSIASAIVTGPYAVDVNTLHLWGLDESGVPAADQAHYNYAGTFTIKPDANQPLAALFGTGSLGNPSYAGFGTAYGGGATSANAGLSALTPANSTTDNVDHTFDNPLTHAFTMEAIVKIAFNPLVATSSAQEIIAGEGDAGDSSDRSWQFRIEANPGAATNKWVLRFQKVSGFGGIGGSTANFNVDAQIPNSGINAIAQDSWFHVAVTYDGTISNATGLKLYWTRLDDANGEANLIGNGMLNGWLRQQDTDFALGNELRDFNGNTEGFNGYIDNVRISDIARGADQFIFVPEPSSFTLLALSGIAAGLIQGRKRRGSRL